MIALAAEMAEKQRRGKEGVAARLQVKQREAEVSLHWGMGSSTCYLQDEHDISTFAKFFKVITVRWGRV